uniref:Uncharacterized protein n=1 Tax=Rhizophora mucronata TaxID=61149 RepID=A0A2P2IHA9_RHIMU
MEEYPRIYGLYVESNKSYMHCNYMEEHPIIGLNGEKRFMLPTQLNL